MLMTAMRQTSFAWAMLSGRRFQLNSLARFVDDVRETIEEFGSLGEGNGDVVSVPDPELQLDLVRRRLRRTVRLVGREVPHYRQWFQANGIDPSRVTLETLTLVAPTPKIALRRAPDTFVSDRAKPALEVTTTGTSGPPTVVWLSRYDVEVITALRAIAMMTPGGLRSHHVYANCIRSRSISSIVVQRSVPLTGAAFLPLGVIEPEIALERLARPVRLPGKEPRVTHLNASASYLALLVQEAEQRSLCPADFGLREIQCGGEILTDALRARAEEVFGARVEEGYSMTEILPMGGRVCSQRHLHIPNDQGYVEVLDPEGHTLAPPGAVGVLTITPYATFREATMVLRYLTGDMVRVLDEGPLTCEMAAVPATSRILGREASGSRVGATTRDVLDLLQAERELPLPSRFALKEATGGPVLYAVADRPTRRLASRLESRAAELGLNVQGIVLVSDRSDLPEPCVVRADLREHSFEGPPAHRAGDTAVVQVG